MRVLILAAVLLSALVAEGQSLRHDRAAALYSSQIRFDADNVPVVTIGVVDGERRVTFSSQGRVRILVDGPGGPEIITEPGRRWTASIASGTAAKTAWHVRLQAFASDQMAAIQDARKVWKSRHVSIKSLDVGSIFGLVGKMLSSQNIVLYTARDYESEDAARRVAARFSKKYNIEAKVMPRIRARARGQVSLTDELITIRSPDVLWMEPVNPEGTITVKQVEYGRGFPWRGRQDRQYRGTLYVTVGRGGGIAVGNMISAEVALKGLVPAEMLPSAPQQALQAQAVAARSELLAKIGRRHHADPYLFCGDVHCQVYAGARREDARTSEAVDATRGRVLVHDERLVDAVYSANCGGHTEHSHAIWIGGPIETLTGKPDGAQSLDASSEANVRNWLTNSSDMFCGLHATGQKSFRWEKKISVAQVRESLRQHASDPGPIEALTVESRGVSGRAVEVMIRGQEQSVSIRGELRIRQLFGSLKSSLFVVDLVRNDTKQVTHLHFRGGGFGHGVGMCQDGAMGRAGSGHTHSTILKHYYTNVSVEKVY